MDEDVDNLNDLLNKTYPLSLGKLFFSNLSSSLRLCGSDNERIEGYLKKQDHIRATKR